MKKKCLFPGFLHEIGARIAWGKYPSFMEVAHLWLTQMVILVSTASVSTVVLRRQLVRRETSWRGLSPSGYQSGTHWRRGGIPIREPTDLEWRPSEKSCLPFRSHASLVLRPHQFFTSCSLNQCQKMQYSQLADPALSFCNGKPGSLLSSFVQPLLCVQHGNVDQNWRWFTQQLSRVSSFSLTLPRASLRTSLA